MIGLTSVHLKLRIPEIQTQFSYIMVTSFSGGGSRREPPTLGKQLVNFITCGWKSSAPFIVIYKAGCEPDTIFNIIYSYKYLESDLIKHCHVIFIHSLGQPLIVRSHSKVHRSRGNPKEIPT
jgi:hypothetical protein